MAKTLLLTLAMDMDIQDNPEQQNTGMQLGTLCH